jgi:hypothetical protein
MEQLTFIVPVLSMITLLAVAVFALVSKARIERRRHDPDAPKSTLAPDAPDTWVGEAARDDGRG